MSEMVIDVCSHYGECATEFSLQSEQCEICYKCGVSATFTGEERPLSEVDALKKLCKELLDGADRCSQGPHYIVQPFLGIVKRHAATIEKHNLL